jgi:hypothetical protein
MLVVLELTYLTYSYYLLVLCIYKVLLNLYIKPLRGHVENVDF